MITNLTLKNFKSHRNSELNLSNLNLLTGLNGMGKSSVLQALLLLRQTHKKGMLNLGLELKGDLCDIGAARDALYQSAEDDYISFILEDSVKGKSTFNFYFDENRQNDTFLQTHSSPTYSSDLSLFSNDFQYISAFRNGPMKDYERDTSQVELFHQISLKEGRSEFSAHYLYFFGKDDISDKNLAFDKKNGYELHQNVQDWMNAISPGIQIQIQQSESSFKINYRFSRGSGQRPTDSFKATNIGFGISYVLPIVISALHAPKGSIVLIENPEAHIHPAGQAKLMELICRSARSGIQFIIETHSDHIINGMLISINDRTLTTDQVSLYYFERKEDTHETLANDLPVLEGGKIRNPPDGFFDQIDIDMKTLLGF